MGRSVLLYLLGVPIPIIIPIALLHRWWSEPGDPRRLEAIVADRIAPQGAYGVPTLSSTLLAAVARPRVQRVVDLALGPPPEKQPNGLAGCWPSRWGKLAVGPAHPGGSRLWCSEPSQC